MAGDAPKQWRYPKPGETFIPVAPGPIISMTREEAYDFFGVPEEERRPDPGVKYYQVVQPPKEEGLPK